MSCEFQREEKMPRRGKEEKEKTKIKKAKVTVMAALAAQGHNVKIRVIF